jgi:hypothetical protein
MRARHLSVVIARQRSLFLDASVCDGAADLEESGAASAYKQERGGIKIPCGRCTCVEILDEMAVLFGRAGCGNGGKRNLALNTGVCVVVGFILRCLVFDWGHAVRVRQGRKRGLGWRMSN